MRTQWIFILSVLGLGATCSLEPIDYALFCKLNSSSDECKAPRASVSNSFDRASPGPIEVMLSRALHTDAGESVEVFFENQNGKTVPLPIERLGPMFVSSSAPDQFSVSLSSEIISQLQPGKAYLRFKFHVVRRKGDDEDRVEIEIQ